MTATQHCAHECVCRAYRKAQIIGRVCIGVWCEKEWRVNYDTRRSTTTTSQQSQYALRRNDPYPEQKFLCPDCKIPITFFEDEPSARCENCREFFWRPLPTQSSDLSVLRCDNATCYATVLFELRELLNYINPDSPAGKIISRRYKELWDARVDLRQQEAGEQHG